MPQRAQNWLMRYPFHLQISPSISRSLNTMDSKCFFSLYLVAFDLPWPPCWEFVIELVDGGKGVRTIHLVLYKSLGLLKILLCASNCGGKKEKSLCKKKARMRRKSPASPQGGKRSLFKQTCLPLNCHEHHSWLGILPELVCQISNTHSSSSPSI